MPDVKIYYMRDNHMFKLLSLDVEVALEEISAEWDEGYTSGSVCSKSPGMPPSVNSRGKAYWYEFTQAVLAYYAAVPKTQQPSYSSKRAAAMAIYTPPFKYQHGYIFDSQSHMVADNGPICDGPSVEGAVASRVRGWGRIGYMPNAAELQDEVGQMMADALNALYQVPPSNAGAEPREASASGNLLEGESTQPKDEK